ncbi:MAG: STAS domain-containing protein [Actinobacteria bacterium]|nr:MAG: STAS domain-containing protein [Actinomycetota bacterium]
MSDEQGDPAMDGQRREVGAMLEISVEQPSDGVFVITPSGELDLSNGELLSDAMSDARGKDAKTLVLDLTGLTFMDSSGLRLLIDAWNESQIAERRLAIVVLDSGLVRRVLEVSGTDAFLPIVGRLDDVL